MTQVLISIRPEWVKKILNGEKNVEVRLNVPNCDLPCEVFMYVTKKGTPNRYLSLDRYHQYIELDKIEYINPNALYSGEIEMDGEEEWAIIEKQALNGKVVAKFIMNDNGIINLNTGYWKSHIHPYAISLTENDMGKLSFGDLRNYAKGKPVYVWKIDNLEVFDKPKELSDFYKNGTMSELEYLNSINYDDYYPDYVPEGVDKFQVDEEIAEYDSTGWEIYKDYLNKQEIKYAPQSWRYVKEIR